MRREGRGDVGVEESETGDGVDIQFTPGVKAVPSKPEQAGPNRDKRNTIRRRLFIPTMPDIKDGSERGKTGNGVDDDAAGEIEHAPMGEQSAAPHHVREGVIDEQLPEDEKDEVSLEGNPVDESAGDEGGRDDGEHHLVSHENELRQLVIAREG